MFVIRGRGLFGLSGLSGLSALENTEKTRENRENSSPPRPLGSKSLEIAKTQCFRAPSARKHRENSRPLGSTSQKRSVSERSLTQNRKNAVFSSAQCSKTQRKLETT